MNKKAYLRGLGAGMIVAAIVMGVASNGKMTDAEILARAKEIEASESTVLTQISEEGEGVIKEIPVKDTGDTSVSAGVSDDNSKDTETSVSADGSTETTTEKSEGETETSVTASVEETTPDAGDKAGETEANGDAETGEASENETGKIDPMPEGESGYTNNEESVEIQIIKGDSSVSVSRRMYEAGLVESAVEFDKYLCSNGYDKSISVGTYEIPYGLDFDEMARIITRRR